MKITTKQLENLVENIVKKKLNESTIKIKFDELPKDILDDLNIVNIGKYSIKQVEKGEMNNNVVYAVTLDRVSIPFKHLMNMKHLILITCDSNNTRFVLQ